METLLQNFVISFFTLLHVPLMNKFLLTENNFFRCFIKQESYGCPHCIFQSLCLEYVHYKNPPKECRKSINYAIN